MHVHVSMDPTLHNPPPSSIHLTSASLSPQSLSASKTSSSPSPSPAPSPLRHPSPATRTMGGDTSSLLSLVLFGLAVSLFVNVCGVSIIKSID